MYLILQQDEPSDYVIATGITTSIREFIKLAGNEAGLTIDFRGEGVNETGHVVAVDETKFVERVGEKYLEAMKQRIANQEQVVGVDPKYFRPTEVDLLIGDPTKSKTKLGWEPKYDLKGLVEDMMQSDIKLFKKDAYLKEGGYQVMNYFE